MQNWLILSVPLPPYQDRARLYLLGACLHVDGDCIYFCCECVVLTIILGDYAQSWHRLHIHLLSHSLFILPHIFCSFPTPLYTLQRTMALQP